MTNKQFLECYMEIQNYDDRDAYVSDMCLAALWGDAADAAILAERITAVGNIWDAVHRGVKDIAAAAGISQRHQRRSMPGQRRLSPEHVQPAQRLPPVSLPRQ